MTGTPDDRISEDLNRIRTGVADSLEIRGGIREKQLGECVTKVNPTKAAKSKHLDIGPLDVDEITDEKGDIPLGHHDVGAAYVTKAEYAKRICISGKQLRYAETNFMGRLGDRLSEGLDFVWDKAVIDAACGQMLTGDECNIKVISPECCIEHNDQGYTPEKLTQAIRLLQEMNNNQAQPIVPLTLGGHEQLTKFAQFTNNDFLINGQRSAYTGSLMRSSMWFGATFKMIGDRTIRNVKTGTCFNMPVIKSEPYVNGAGQVVPHTFVRYIPIWDKRAIYWEPGYAPQVIAFPIWKERAKPFGTSEVRIDAEFGMGRVDNCGVVIMKIVEQNKLLRL